MTRSEITAYNAGIIAVLELALRSAQALEPRLIEKPTRYSFAIEALDALAEESAGLLLDMPPITAKLPETDRCTQGD